MSSKKNFLRGTDQLEKDLFFFIIKFPNVTQLPKTFLLCEFVVLLCYITEDALLWFSLTHTTQNDQIKHFMVNSLSKDIKSVQVFFKAFKLNITNYFKKKEHVRTMISPHFYIPSLITCYIMKTWPQV